MENKDHISFAVQEFPPLLNRIKAAMIDLIIILIIFSLSSILIDVLGDPPNWVRGMIFIFSIYLYEPMMLTFFGGTLGHLLLGLRIRRMENQHDKLNIFQASGRFLVKYLLSWISFLTVATNSKKRAIHDLASGSIVLYK
ncbi:RDD family protein [Echinicola sp. 20G]|uniref:RDD family protein n=1 Tax=Echinicola sp. 20G TaxID=2781961 RepID=UPI001910D801|nr:RDD family protein [Echinicola sp. 20G]